MRILTSALLTLTVVSMVGCGAAHDVPTAEPVTVQAVESPTLMAWTFEDAVAQCEETFEGQEWEDCVDAALTSWCMFEPFPPESEFHTEEDARCIAEQALEESK